MTPTPGGTPVEPLTTSEIDLEKDSMLGDRFMIRFSEDTLQHRPLGIRLMSNSWAPSFW